MDMMKNKELSIPQQAPQKIEITQQDNRTSITVWDITTIMMFGLWLSDNARGMDWYWCLLPISIPYIVIGIVKLYKKFYGKDN